GSAAYETERIPGAFYLDLEKDLSAPVREDGAGGRHPLPDFEALADKLTQLGAVNGRCVVAYDDQGGAMASRLWWLLAFMGHDAVYVLDGGFSAWKRAGYPTDGGEAPIPEGSSEAGFEPQLRSDWVVTAADIAA